MIDVNVILDNGSVSYASHLVFSLLPLVVIRCLYAAAANNETTSHGLRGNSQRRIQRRVLSKLYTRQRDTKQIPADSRRSCQSKRDSFGPGHTSAWVKHGGRRWFDESVGVAAKNGFDRGCRVRGLWIVGCVCLAFSRQSIRRFSPDARRSECCARVFYGFSPLCRRNTCRTF